MPQGDVQTGIAAEYGPKVLDTAVRAARARQLGSGVLIFDRGAFSIIRSSRSVFAHLTTAVVLLLTETADRLTEENVDALLHGGELWLLNEP